MSYQTKFELREFFKIYRTIAISETGTITICRLLLISIVDHIISKKHIKNSTFRCHFVLNFEGFLMFHPRAISEEITSLKLEFNVVDYYD